jgi:hypothetical protein
MSDTIPYTRPTSFEVPEGGLASFLTATVGDWADESLPETGIATAKAAADQLAEYGRYEDTYMVHAAEGETVVPMAVFDENPKLRASLFRQMRSMGIDPDRYVVGNELNSINPVTGQPEFFLKKLFKGLKKAVKSVVKVVKKAAPIILGIGLNMIPGLGAIAAGALSGGISSLAAGGNFKDALKSAAIGGALGGLFKGVQGGIQAKQAGDTFVSGFGEGVRRGLPGAELAAQKAGEAAVAQGLKDQTAMLADIGVPGAPTTETILRTTGAPAASTASQAAQTAARLPPANVPSITATPAAATAAAAPVVTLGTQAVDSAISGASGAAGVRRTPSELELLQTGPQQPAPVATAQVPGGLVTPENVPAGFRQSVKDAFTSEGGTFIEDMKKAFLPRRVTAADYLPKNVTAEQAANMASNVPGQSLLEAAEAAASSANAAAGLTEGIGGMVRQFGPGFAAGTGILAATGGFEQPEMEIPQPYGGVTGKQLLDENPELYRAGRVQYAVPGTTTTAAAPTTVYTPYVQLPRAQVAQPAQPVMVSAPIIRQAADGGAMTRENFPRQNGAIDGPGTGTSDDIPAMLSDGEFVFTAKAVRGAGNGSRDNGVRKMYQIMRQFESVA